jgi:hypothetical protein
MTSRDFCYWLQGYFELRNGKGSGWSTEQAAMVEKHLALVFKHEIDPSAGPPEHQKELDAIHHPEAKPPVKDPLAHARPRPDADPFGPMIRC